LHQHCFAVFVGYLLSFAYVPHLANINGGGVGFGG